MQCAGLGQAGPCRAVGSAVGSSAVREVCCGVLPRGAAWREGRQASCLIFTRKQYSDALAEHVHHMH